MPGGHTETWPASQDGTAWTWLARRWARWRSVLGCAGGTLSGGPRQLLPEDVLDFLAGLLEVALGLIGAALGFEGLITGGLAGAFLGFALGRLGGVLDLVFCAYRAASLCWGAAGRCLRPAGDTYRW
jgi:hypothetical protein